MISGDEHTPDPTEANVTMPPYATPYNEEMQLFRAILKMMHDTNMTGSQYNVAMITLIVLLFLASIIMYLVKYRHRFWTPRQA